MTLAQTDYTPRDYSLTGPEGKHAIEMGLASAEWYHSVVPRKVMKQLMKRSDGAAMRDTLLWFGLLAISGGGGILFWGSWWCVPFFVVYGVLYGSASDSRWHECGHGTAFRTGWMNDVVYHIACFMQMRNPVNWRWSHVRHHTDTIIVGRDAEISVKRPPSMIFNALHFIGLPDTYFLFRVLVLNAMGKVSDEEKNYIPESEWHKPILPARIHVAIQLVAVVLALVTWSILPLMIIGGPRIYGTWHMIMTGLLQHGGMAEDVLDHRLNSRTVMMNPISRWIYWNMNYHVEHHMFPMVPFHALPQLHALIKDDLPIPNPSIAQAYGEMIAALWRQRSDPTYTIRPVLPATAQPFREEFHEVGAARP